MQQARVTTVVTQLTLGGRDIDYVGRIQPLGRSSDATVLDNPRGKPWPTTTLHFNCNVSHAFNESAASATGPATAKEKKKNLIKKTQHILDGEHLGPWRG